jgi:hypothetical protein
MTLPQVVEHDNLVARGDKVASNDRADVSSASGDEQSHAP